MDEIELLQIIEQAARDQWTDLDLARKDLTILPPQIGQVTSLRELHLSRNQLTTLPAEMGHLTNLRELGLGSNRLTTLPAEIGQLKNLEELYLDWNQLVSLPRELGNLTSLVKLELHVNQLTALPAEIGQLKSLSKLGLGSNQLTTLPAEIGQLTSLLELYLDNNQLTALPSVVLQLKGLTRLDLAKNGLTELPAEIRELSNLKMLGLARNKLTELPAEIGELANLTNLYLDGNQLTRLPPEVGKLTRLERLYLHDGNEQLGIPPEILGPTAQEVNRYQKEPIKPLDILNYYFRIRNAPRALNEAKLILVGYGSVGKTSLVNRLVHDHFDSGEKQTEGIKITQWSLRLKEDEDVRINIWDFGGQEIMHSTHQFFLTKRSLYLLVLNGRQGHEDADAEYWLSLIESFGEESSVIVVLNKIKEYAFDVNRRALKQKFPAIRDIIETDCADRTGINALRQAIERETNQLEHLRDAFPATWFAIKEQLASMAANYLTFEQYRDICAEHGETDAQMQTQLGSYLHMLGIALNYRDDRRLRDMHVLNPRWVTSGIYTILNAEHLARQKGELHVDELPNILDRATYPPERYGFLLDLMRKFELSFSFPEEDERYLVTGLLDKQQPPEADAFSPEACLNFEYHYPTTLPEGLLPRFIVRTNVLSRDQPRWRTGVILQFEGNQALVQADMQAKKVLIHVSGPVSSRRRLLAVIRSDFEHIHQNFKFNPQEMIPVSGHPGLVVPYEKLVVFESNRVESFLEVADRKTIALDVQELLNGVDLEGTRSSRQGTDGTRGALKLFYSYAHEDEHLRDELETHLKILHRQGLIETWYDRKIGPGDHWKGEIDTNLEAADVILLLVSADFIASDYCYEVEMSQAMERYAAGQVRVVPIIVRDVNWCKPPLDQFQALPKDGQAIMTWPNRDTAWRNVSEGIERIVQELLKNRKM